MQNRQERSPGRDSRWFHRVGGLYSSVLALFIMCSLLNKSEPPEEMDLRYHIMDRKNKS